MFLSPWELRITIQVPYACTEGLKVKIILSYTVSLRTAWATRNPVLIQNDTLKPFQLPQSGAGGSNTPFLTACWAPPSQSDLGHEQEP